MDGEEQQLEEAVVCGEEVVAQLMLGRAHLEHASTWSERASG